MQGYGTDTYRERWADIYDSWYGVEHGEGKTQRTVAALAELAAEAGGGRVLELAIATGRIALPLAARGLVVHGIDASAAMVAKPRAPGPARTSRVARTPRAGWPSGHTRPRQQGHVGVVRRKRRLDLHEGGRLRGQKREPHPGATNRLTTTRKRCRLRLALQVYSANR